MDLYFSVLQLTGGLAVFIYGIEQLSDGLEKAAGAKLLSFLEKAAGNRINGILFGTTAVGILQSSGMLMVTLMGLINAGMLSLEHTVGIMLGSEIGTTVTGQLVAFQIKGIELWFLSIGFYLLFFTNKKHLQTIGAPLFGVGLVFLGMNLMSTAGKTLSQLPAFLQLLELVSKNVPLGILIGALFTALMQSSSAMTGLVIAMGGAGIIDLTAAIVLMFGANIGSCITGWLASLRSSVTAKRASYAQIFINIGGVILFAPFVVPYSNLVAQTSTMLPRQIANAHTIFNIVVSLLLLPFVKQITWLVTNLVKGKEKPDKEKVTQFIDEQFYNTPSVAVSIAKAEVMRMGWFTHDMLKEAEKCFIAGKKKHALVVLEKEPQIDAIAHQTDIFMEGIPADKLNQEDRKNLDRLKHVVTDIERVGDHAVNIAEFAQQMEKREIQFTKYAHQELKEMFETVAEAYGGALKAFDQHDHLLMDIVIQAEDEVDDMEKKFKKNHVRRLRKGLCMPEADPIFVETLRNLERISDHAYNIALSILY